VVLVVDVTALRVGGDRVSLRSVGTLSDQLDTLAGLGDRELDVTEVDAATDRVALACRSALGISVTSRTPCSGTVQTGSASATAVAIGTKEATAVIAIAARRR